jgi:uncharacterized membrane protein YeaQ/YmgE (transglycosylase-associated protein family)
MFPLPLIIIIFFLLTWLVLGLVVGWLIGIVMTRLLPASESKIIADLISGVVGCLAGVFISGWASKRTFNSGMPRSFFIWDENGQAIDWRTALAEHQGLLAILGAVILVVLWRLAVVARRKANEKLAAV